MTVAEYIELLKAMPQELDVIRCSASGQRCEAPPAPIITADYFTVHYLDGDALSMASPQDDGSFAKRYVKL